jgi:hypothetical protein
MPNVSAAKCSLRAAARSWVVRISTELSALLTVTLPRRGSEGCCGARTAHAQKGRKLGPYAQLRFAWVVDGLSILEEEMHLPK